MKRVFFLCLVLMFHFGFSSSTKEELDEISLLVKSDIDSAYSYSLELKKKYSSANDIYGIVKSNFWLAYIQKKRENFGKSVIYYLEAIRFSDNASYDDVHKDKISLRKNLANIFQSFNAHELASRYNQEAIFIAEEHDSQANLISLKFNEGRNLELKGDHDLSIDLFLSILPISEGTRKCRVLNEIGILYQITENYSESERYFNLLYDFSKSDQRFRRYQAQALHNLAEIYFSNKEFDRAVASLENSIKIKESNEKPDVKGLFTSYKTLGEYNLHSGGFSRAKLYFEKAEGLIDKLPSHIDNFDLYQLYAELNFRKGNSVHGKYYSDLYSNKLIEHIALEKKIREIDQRFNMDLITQRYFAEVQKQDRIAEIKFISQLTSGSLLALLLLVIGYYQYQKIVVRRNIEKELVSLKILD